ncbi:hypothetical protein [Treponema brennaborense]|uniref:DUF2802 domain-containing protein n=1 Tax=Treponema brennaborense (strain DSM 12168 / CIP 105900 / DD5/3) TaxID=906968 RepID=F4LKX9_TREBD|nr:hypothetical protein [Treponema brennaborense]AEE16576.1 hypothetical protein Trebr_1148 [Treponema brennaborense DSM 12168]
MSAVFAGIVLGCINVALWLFFFVRFKKRFSPAKILEEIKVEVDKLIIEISRETDRDITLIDARIKGLKALIEEANRCTALATGELDKRSREHDMLSALKRAGDKGSSQNDLFSGPALAALADVPPDEITISGGNGQTAAVPSAAVPADPLFPEEKILPVIVKAPEQISVKKDIRSQVLELAAEGFVPEDIAAKLGMSVTEVQLITDMYGSV